MVSVVELEGELLGEIAQLKAELARVSLENEHLSAKLSFTEGELLKFSQAVVQAVEAVIITDKNAIIEYVNPAFTVITGYAAPEVIGQKTTLFQSDAHNASFYKDLWRTISQGQIWHGILIEKKKDGTFYPGLMTISPIVGLLGEVTHFVAIQHDMTKERELEEQFMQAQKMEAIGTLVGGVAHDFNNVLAAMHGNIFLARRKLDNPEYVQEMLESMGQLSDLAVAMVKQLLTFARKDKVAMKTFALNTFMKEGFKLARSAIPENISQVCNTCKEKLIIKGDATQLQQVLMNLVNNACFAVRDVENPQVCCELRYVKTDAAFKAKHPECSLAAADYACLSVRDNGHGITRKQRDKIFEPFYTTKGVGEGTGLGLSMVSASVERHGGLIEVETKLGMGTAFNIYLPLEEMEEQSLEEGDAEIVLGKGETILFVDDDVLVRETIASVLVNMGYHVLQASNGVAAVKILRENSCEVDLVIADVVMPSMGGLTVVKQMRDLSPEMPFIFISGYDQSGVHYVEHAIQRSAFMSKPFSYGVLSSKIRELLR